jgi:heterodisulfide reductase subunit A
MANIRDQCSWVHMHEAERATAKARDLLRIACAKVRLDEALMPLTLEVNHNALVIGGGLAGMTAALELADQGFGVHLVERSPELGGYMKRMHYLLEGDDPQEALRALINRVSTQTNLTIHTNAAVSAITGSLGNFESTVTMGGNGATVAIRHGAVIVATGAVPLVPHEYLYGSDPRVLLHEELEQQLANESFRGESVAFIQCVGSREAGRPYCSRTCCAESIKQALRLKSRWPDSAVAILYREMRPYGFRESYYSLARKLGVTFIRFPDDQPPGVEPHNGRLRVTVHAATVHETAELLVDNVVLAAATCPDEGNKELAQLLKVPLSEDGFFLEAHRKLRPVDFATDGIFLCGDAHSPLGIAESIAQALAASARAATILSKGRIDLEPTIARVDAERCDGCAFCVEPCPYKAIALVEVQEDGRLKRRVEVNESLCKGCGTCMATCPKRAVFVQHFRPEMLSAEVRAALEVETAP